jgi:hypothetical protein
MATHIEAQHNRAEQIFSFAKKHDGAYTNEFLAMLAGEVGGGVGERLRL